jgi:hypothetical protein
MYPLGVQPHRGHKQQRSAFTQIDVHHPSSQSGGGALILSNAIDKLLEFMLADNRQCMVKKSVFPRVPRIIAIGDIHGDFKALLDALRLSGVIEPIKPLKANYHSPFDGSQYYRWSGGKTFVVQLGDLLDRGGRGISTQPKHEMEEVQVLKFLYDLSQEAIRAGGRVIALIGNHELMNVMGDFRYASREHIKGMGGEAKRRDLFKPGGKLANKMACFCYGLVKIGDWIFAHAGVLPEHVAKLTKVYTGYKHSDQISKTFFEKSNALVHGILTGTVSIDSMTEEERFVLFGGDGIFWTRHYGRGQSLGEDKCQLAYQTLQTLNGSRVGGIVVGHTPQNRINTECGGHVIRVDTGMSEAFGGRSGKERIEVLEIKNIGGRETVQAISSVERTRNLR